MKSLGRMLLILIMGAAPAWATLGQPESSVEADGHFLRGQIRRESRPAYRLHLITDASGTEIREYVSPAGVVFAVSWQGPSIPSMKQLLGTHFTELQAFAQHMTDRRGGPIEIQQRDFVFASGGRMRDYRGKALLRSLLPPGVSPEVVQ